jgi:hypothetical protein
MEKRSSTLDTRLVKFVQLGREVSSGFLTRTIRDWPTAKAVIGALGENQERFPTSRVVVAVGSLFPRLWAIQAGIDCGPVIYFRLPLLIEDQIANIGRDRNTIPSRWFSVDEHERMADAIEATIADLGATPTVQYSKIVYPIQKKAPHTVRALWK